MTTSAPLDREPELPPRPAAIKSAVTVLALTAAVAGGVWPVRVLPPLGAEAHTATGADIAAAMVTAVIFGGPITVVAVQLWRGATLAYAVAVAACGLTGFGLVTICVFPPVIGYALGRPVPDGVEVLLGTPGRASFTVAAVLALVALFLLRTGGSREWIARMYRYRIDESLRRASREAADLRGRRTLAE